MRNLVAAVAIIGISTAALAEDLRPSIDEQSGSWMAMSFTDGPVVKICVAGSLDGKISFRADSNDIEFRSSNDSWSLSADASGDVSVKAGPVEKTFHVAAMSATTLSGTVNPDELKPLFDAMDNASSAQVSFNGKKSITASLAGSTRSLNSFRTCVAANGFGNLGSSAGPNASPF
ncbi:hypothetical protein NFI95_15555 [Acetobacteraceae bacterium KSS8]|uniref:Uncharacterized protein n=1 Tax=Endosaccharibacter trunci TaxID=2812733 RepID=A0ABT1WAF9_9PROT|nr:hypothetical protein [Acetobacteraceae bacterium KSS8]